MSLLMVTECNGGKQVCMSVLSNSLYWQFATEDDLSELYVFPRILNRL
ncbi:hypothetical Protein YC6258_01502 [Gynuella sunshinyii YC6258]|uniref:Uncharacterized protein n=1 Tax=Gynuella sunshinyii YC6258 TaxID=1445510 RepID=A0A0C5V1W8_9GAMM|nr:hypothetical Protein YC6258_01502 [Gynuella sunshinyii YC6258]